MEWNRRKFNKVSNKKILHKIKKQWVVISSALFIAICSTFINSVNFPVHAQTREDISNPSRINNKQQSSLPHSNNIHNSKSIITQVNSQAQKLHNQIINNNQKRVSNSSNNKIYYVNNYVNNINQKFKDIKNENNINNSSSLNEDSTKQVNPKLHKLGRELPIPSINSNNEQTYSNMDEFWDMGNKYDYPDLPTGDYVFVPDYAAQFGTNPQYNTFLVHYDKKLDEFYELGGANISQDGLIFSPNATNYYPVSYQDIFDTINSEVMNNGGIPSPGTEADFWGLPSSMNIPNKNVNLTYVNFKNGQVVDNRSLSVSEVNPVIPNDDLDCPNYKGLIGTSDNPNLSKSLSSLDMSNVSQMNFSFKVPVVSDNIVKYGFCNSNPSDSSNDSAQYTLDSNGNLSIFNDKLYNSDAIINCSPWRTNSQSKLKDIIKTISTNDVHLPSDANNLFSNLPHVNSINLSGVSNSDVVNDSSTQNMQDLFKNDINLTYLNLGNKFDTSYVNNMSGMFQSDKSLVSIPLTSDINTSDVSDMSNMFKNDSSIESLDLGLHGTFDTSSVDNMNGMFNSDSNLRYLRLGQYFDTTNVNNMSNMFSHLPQITTIGFSNSDDIDLGNNFNTNNCLYFGATTSDESKMDDSDREPILSTQSDGMFADDSNLQELDLSNLHTVVDASWLIKNDNKISNINLSNFNDDDSNSNNRPYSSYDVLIRGNNSSSPDLKTVTLNNNTTFKKDTSKHSDKLDELFDKNHNVQPVQFSNDGNYYHNFLDGSWYQVSSNGALTEANLEDGHPHQGTWFKNKGHNVIIYENQNGKQVKVEDGGQVIGQNNNEANFINYVRGHSTPNGYYIPNIDKDISISEDNNNGNATPDYIAIVHVLGKRVNGITKIPAKFYQADGTFKKRGLVNLHYSGRIGDNFTATTNNLDNIPDNPTKPYGSGYYIKDLKPANNLGVINPTGASSNSLNFVSNEPTADYVYISHIPPKVYKERIPYEFINQNGQRVGNLNYLSVANNSDFSMNSTIPTNFTLPKGYQWNNNYT